MVMMSGRPGRCPSNDAWRSVWVSAWGYFCRQRGDAPAREAAYRELAGLIPDETPAWIFLGASLAVQGKLDEAEAIHRHATQLRGDTDEAYFNLGLVLRAAGRLEEAAAALERSLQICPDYPEASSVLADVRAAIDLRNRNR
jgi:Flp pilus assembly protein TadD